MDWKELWSTKRFEDWVNEGVEMKAWDPDEDGVITPLQNLLEGIIDIQKDQATQALLVHGQQLAQQFYEGLRTMGHQKIVDTAQPHMRTAAILTIAASILRPRAGKMDDMLTDTTLDNIKFCELASQMLTVIAAARIVEALDYQRTDTGF